MNDHTRLQAYLRHTASGGRTVVPVPPFTLYLDQHTDFKFFNYAIPDAPVGGDLGEALGALRAAFAAHQRMPRFEFLAEFAPNLAPALETDGFRAEGRYPLMVCTPATARPAPAVDGLTIERLTPASPTADLVAFHTVQRGAFADSDEAAAPTAEEVARFRAGLATGGAFLARLDGTPVGVANFSIPFDGLTEVTGIGTSPAFRRRGIAAAVTAAAVATAFAEGVEIALLSAGDERAGRVYERIGFATAATALAYSTEG